MKSLFFLCAMTLCTISTLAQPNVYDVSSIPDNLKSNFAVVHRLDEAVLRVESASRYIYTIHQVTTVFNEAGASAFRHTLPVSKFYKVKSAEIKLIKDNGETEKVFTKKDFETFDAYDGVSLVTDDKEMLLHTPVSKYPATVEVRYELESTSYIGLPGSFINTATELFRFVVVVPKALDIRYKAKGVPPAVVSESSGTKTYAWEAKNVIPDRIPGRGYSRYYYMPGIEVFPLQFEYDGYKGSFADWKSYGAWNYALYNDRSFDKDWADNIKSIAKDGGEREKIDAIYRHMQKDLRYVSIQLGIGGFKPFSTKFVDQKKYGDCKALTNYMRTALSVVGINSYPALVNAGYNKAPLDPAFPAQRFNHVILCVPLQKDTMWLECTSNTAATGFLGTFTENKDVLLLTERGGILARTPASQYKENRLVTSTELDFNDALGGSAIHRVFATGDFRSLFADAMRRGATAQQEFLEEGMDYRKISAYQLLRNADSSTGHTASFNFTFQKLFDFKAGSKVFIQPYVNKLWAEVLENDRSRTIEYLFEGPFEKVDITRINFPKGYRMEGSFPEKSIKEGVLEYQRTVKVTETGLEITRRFVIQNHVIPAQDYGKVASLIKQIIQEENQKIVLVKD